jgi:carbonic anhydrase/acetyltransferase-like protein (isoleucine patch superfamily)
MFLMNHAGIYSYRNHTPKFGSNPFLASGAYLIGDLIVGDDCSFWFNVTVRADCNYIRIGNRTNVQDGSVIHVTYKDGPTIIGDDVTIGHNATLHACTIANKVLIGMNATILDGASISERSYVGAGSLVTPGKTFPPGVLIVGSPAKVVRDLTAKEIEYLDISVKNYLMYKQGYEEQEGIRAKS